MRKMPVISTDRELNDRIELICEKYREYFSPIFFENGDEALEFIMYELPEINVINFSDRKINALDILHTIKADPWLHYGGVVGVHSRRHAKQLNKEMLDSNIISLIPRSEFVGAFFRVLRILVENRQIIFQRDLQSNLMRTISGSFVMDNDPFNVRTYANLVTNFLYNSNYINQDKKERLHVALFEMLMNAVEHGNCSISYEEKTDWLETHGDILDLIRAKCRTPEIKRRKVYFSYRITPERSFYTIRDEGGGFDWRRIVNPKAPEAQLALHGHGVRMTNHYMENLRYNDRGNEVSFELTHQHNESNIVPGIFEDQKETVFYEGEVVFREGEESNHLYYIVSGKLGIYSSDMLISTLTPDDIFLGEMSFLLNNHRSATVVSEGKSVLVKISKNAFINVIKRKPHYGIFLARLLAQRLSKLNTQVVALQS
jgi:anti-sigma regulatory factor (Ser/Thr protein kinase)